MNRPRGTGRGVMTVPARRAKGEVGVNVADGIGRWAEEAPCAVALVDGDRSIHYRTLDAAAWRAARWLRAQGLGPGDVVGISCGSDSALQVVAVYALARIGAVQITLARGEAPAVRRALARHFRVCAILSDDDAAPTEALPVLLADPAWLTADGAPIERGPTIAGGDMPWTIKLSSGTTGAPKGILRTHRQQAVIDARGYRASGDLSGDRLLGVLPLSFTYGINTVMDVLRAGGTVYLMGRKPSGAEILDIIDRRGITRIAMTPSHAAEFLAILHDDRPRCPGLRHLCLGSAPVPDTMRDAVRRRITPHLFVKYATNETTHLTLADPSMLDMHSGTVGHPYDGVDLEIVDDAGTPLPDGEVGLVRFRAEGFPSAYIDNPEASVRMFRDGWFYPGDLGARTPEGMLTLKGRSDDVINFGGINVYPADIEAMLLEHPAVVEAAAFPLPHPIHGQVPAAAVVLRHAIPPGSLAQFCGERLAKGLALRLMVLPALPKNAVGKVIRRQLAAMVPAESA